MVDGRGAVVAWSAGASGAGAALAALFADGKTPWQRALFILLVLVAGIAFAILLAAGLQGVGSLWRARRTKGSEVPARRPSLEVSRFGFIEGFVPPLEPVCDRIRQAVARAEPAGIVVFTGHSGYGKTGLAGWACREMQKDFHTIVAVEFRDDWPKDVRGERAFEEFRLQIHQASRSSEGLGFDELLAAESTLLILDDVRTESDLGPFFPFCDKCTVLLTAVDSRIATALKAGSRPFTHFDLTSSKETVWVSEWARRILTREWKSVSAAGDLIERCASWPLLAARLNLAVRHQAAPTPGLVAFNETVGRVATRLSSLGPDEFDSPGSRHTSVGKSVEFMLETIAEVFVPPPSDPGDRLKELGALPSDAMVPVEVLNLMWDSKSKEATSSLVEHLCDLGMVQFDRPETSVL